MTSQEWVRNLLTKWSTEDGVKANAVSWLYIEQAMSKALDEARSEGRISGINDALASLPRLWDTDEPELARVREVIRSLKDSGLAKCEHGKDMIPGDPIAFGCQDCVRRAWKSK